VLVARRLLPAGTDRLAGACEIREGGLDASPARLLELAPGVEAIVADPTVVVDEELLDAAGPQLRVVANFAVVYDKPRSSSRIRLPEGARWWTSVPPPAPLPITITS
jgi:lactate dehydrogenase-like 2-hydroxyacid dehydrogenase